MTGENNKETKWYESMTVKLLLLGTMALVFLIPLQLIKMVIRERENYSSGVKMEISEQWGKTQTITGPVLNIPVYRTPTDEKRQEKPDIRIWHILPDNLDVSGDIHPEIRKKSIYKTVIYSSSIDLDGYFSIPEQTMDNYNILWDESYISIGISDNHGLINQVLLNFNGSTIDAEPGLFDQDVYNSGLSFPVKIHENTLEMPFSLELKLRGSGGIYFTPVAKTTKVVLESDWPSPSFSGRYLPTSRDISESGFTSSWETTHLNRNFPQEWIGHIQDISDEAFGVNLITGVDHYQKSERSAKYGLLFIAFTFLALVFIELSSEKRIHIFSYFLVSLALVLFFSLLNALSEHLGFNLAYLLASVSIVIMISGFSASLLKDRKRSIRMALMLTILYAFLFFLLSLNEYAYLVGNIGLFIGLAAIMWFTAKTDIFRKNGL